jgi:hypothetical protein
MPRGAAEKAILFALPMHRLPMRAWLLALLVASFSRSSALADGTLTIHVANDSVDSLIVSLYDRNLRRRQNVLSGQVIDGNASISVTISADAAGQGHVYWTAMTVDRDMRQCGHHDKRGVNDGETIHVTADGRCSHR